MAGTVYNPEQFKQSRESITSMLPDSIKKVLDTLFPADDPLGGMMPPIMGSGVIDPGRAALAGKGPLAAPHKNPLPGGQAGLSKHLPQEPSVVPPPTNAMDNVDSAVQRYVEIIEKLLNRPR
jgi:hypothetical protein